MNLPRNYFLKICLSLMEKLLAAVNRFREGGYEVAGLKRHMKLKMSDIFAEVFLLQGINRLNNARIQDSLLIPTLHREST